jgi:hypothetical protein
VNSNHQGGEARPTGEVRHVVTRNLGDLRVAPRSWTWKNWLHYRRRDLPKLVAGRFIGRVTGMVTMEARLSGRVYRRPILPLEQLFKLRELLDQNVDVRELQSYFGGRVVDYGTLSTRVVTDAGVAYIVDAFQNLTELENFKYHGYGTGTTAEAASQTGLITELTTQYAVDNTRVTGSQTEGAANIYRSVATLSPDTGGTIAITEHGLFSAASGTTLLDRSVFSAINVAAGADSLQTTYDLTVASGG